RWTVFAPTRQARRFTFAPPPDQDHPGPSGPSACYRLARGLLWGEPDNGPDGPGMWRLSWSRRFTRIVTRTIAGLDPQAEPAHRAADLDVVEPAPSQLRADPFRGPLVLTGVLAPVLVRCAQRLRRGPGVGVQRADVS